MKEVAKKREGRRNSKESFTKMNKDKNMEDIIGSEMDQSNVEIIKKMMEESRSREAESSMDKGHKENNLTRTWSRDPMLAYNLLIGKLLVLDHAVIGQLVKLVLHCGRHRPQLLRSPHSDELSILNHRK
jgi:hypothetical protein